MADSSLALPVLSGAGAFAKALIIHLQDELFALFRNKIEQRRQDDSTLSELRCTCSKAFQRDSQGEQLLVDIWNAAFPADPIDDARKGDHWKRLGFQSADPFTDIRAGQLGPLQLHYIATKYPKDLEKLADEARVSGYPFACSCFNVSQILAVFFDLYETPAMNPVSGARLASRAQLRNFTRLCNASPGSVSVVLNELFCALVKQLHETWRSMRVTRDCSIMDFSQALREVYDRNADFWRSRHANLSDLNDLVALGQPHGDAALSSRLHRIVAEALESTLHALDLQILLAATTFEAILGRGKVDIEPACYGEYVPPMPVVQSADWKKGSWLAKPVEDLDLDAFFGDSSPVAEASQTSLTTCGSSTNKEPQNNLDLLTGPCADDPQSAPALAESRVSNITAELDLERFFKDWGLSDEDQRQSDLLQNELMVSGLQQSQLQKVKDLDAFLESCL